MNFSSGKERGEEEANYDDAVHDAVNFPSVGNGTKLAMTIVPSPFASLASVEGKRREEGEGKKSRERPL